MMCSLHPLALSIHGADCRQDGGFDRDGLQEERLGNYLMLYGLRGVRGAPTLCCDSVMALDALSEADGHLLRNSGFTFKLTQTGEGKGSEMGGEGRGKPVVRDHPVTGLPQVRTVEFVPEATPEALGAYERLQRAMAERVGFGVELGLDGNDMLLLNNRSAVHGRVGFAARYDGKDRWLQRHGC